MKLKAATALICLALASSGCSNPSGNKNGEGAPSPVPTAGLEVSDGIVLGSGWYPVEQFGGKTFRWANNNSEITVCPGTRTNALQLTVEPGPGVGSKTFALHVTSNHGDHITSTVRGLQDIQIPVSKSAPAETFILRADSKNRPTPNETRILNYRVLKATLDSPGVECKKDIVKDGSPLLVGPHWFAPESFQGERFRWADNDAEIKLTAPQPKPFVVEAFVEPGPGLGGEPLKLSMKNDKGGVSRAQDLRARGYVEFHLSPAPAGAILTLNTDSKNVKSPGDPRILNFRVFDMKIKPQS